MGLLGIFKRKSRPVDSNFVFDKAKFHDDSIQQLGLDEEQSFVHTGLFFAWLVNNGLTSDFFTEETGNEIELLKNRRISPSTIYMNWDGVLLGEMLNDKGFNFALSYFDFDKGTYLADYERVFNVTGDNIFTVNDTWDNYEKIKPAIDLAYEKWQKKITDSKKVCATCHRWGSEPIILSVHSRSAHSLSESLCHRPRLCASEGFHGGVTIHETTGSRSTNDSSCSPVGFFAPTHHLRVALKDGMERERRAF
jgi:hypothetical protein